MTVLRAALVVFAGLSGVAVALSAHPRVRRPALSRRLVPYLGASGSERSSLLTSHDPITGWMAVFAPVRDAIAARLTRVFDDGLELPERLEAAGSLLDASRFRGEQVTWGLGGLVMGFACGMLAVGSGRTVSPAFVLVMAASLAAGGVAARDRALTRAIRRRRSAAESALPTVVDLVCLSVTAGESLRGAIELVAESGHGPLTDELARALRASRAGSTLVDALEARAHVLGVPAFDRFVDAVVAAQERGIPLADALRSLAIDVREQQKRDLIEVAGRKQISMLVPVITLILPVAIVFAFYPGIVAIRTLAR